MIELRPEVLAFAEAMELKLRKHDATRGTLWKTDPMLGLMEHLGEELGELIAAIELGEDPQIVLNECADVGNLAMMVADRYALLKAENNVSIG